MTLSRPTLITWKKYQEMYFIIRFHENIRIIGVGLYSIIIQLNSFSMCSYWIRFPMNFLSCSCKKKKRHCILFSNLK